LQLVV